MIYRLPSRFSRRTGCRLAIVWRGVIVLRKRYAFLPRETRIVFEHSGQRTAGYAALVERYALNVVPNWHRSVVFDGSVRRTDTTPAGVVDVFPSNYWPGDDPGSHLEFALKYDGTNPGLLAAILPAIGPEEITRFVQSKPTGKYARRIWYFHELLTGERLPLADLTQGNYIDLLEPEDYLTLERGHRVRRQRVNDNMLGDERFCPVVRRSDTIKRFIDRDLAARCSELIRIYPAELLKRAQSYLYTKETKSSFEIEHIKPDAGRTERFIALLRAALTEDLCRKARLIELQNSIVDPRFRDDDYRSNQNYIGETVHYGNERIHFVCPRPEHVEALMAGLIDAHRRIELGGVHPVAHAALVGYGFVFVHPFEYGNGRIHRLLIHNILSRRGLAPEGVIFPVSAVMLKQSAAYDASLESFSRPILGLVEYTLDEEGRMTVHNDAGIWYRYPDMTAQVESLFAFVEQTIETELVEELAFLANYDRTKRSMQEIIDLPDREIDLFIRFCLQNNGKLCQRKRDARFSQLTDEEIVQLEQAVSAGYEPVSPASDNGVEAT